jgi:hypothetical protein
MSTCFRASDTDFEEVSGGFGSTIHNPYARTWRRTIADRAVIHHGQTVPALFVHDAEVVFGVAFAPTCECAHYDAESMALRRQDIFGSRRPVAIASANEHTFPFEEAKPVR